MMRQTVACIDGESLLQTCGAEPGAPRNVRNTHLLGLATPHVAKAAFRVRCVVRFDRLGLVQRRLVLHLSAHAHVSTRSETVMKRMHAQHRTSLARATKCDFSEQPTHCTPRSSRNVRSSFTLIASSCSSVTARHH